MRKIPTLYERDWAGDRSRVTRAVNPEAAWVLTEPCRATRKRDGTACLWTKEGSALRLWKRYDAKNGKAPPDGFVPAQDPDPATGHWPGWLPVQPNRPEDKWHVLAATSGPIVTEPGTYELCGPRLQTNAEGLEGYRFFRHGAECLDDAPRDYDGLAEYLAAHVMEGIVWHHADGRMAKIKARDFGLAWPR